MYTIPAPRLDPATLPPVIHTGEPGSFAHRTLKHRIPAILRDAIAANDFPPDIVANLEALHAELTTGVIRGLEEETPDRAFWDAACAPHIGHSWLDVPWFWAEAYFYRRLLEATAYFQPGPTQGYDPYTSIKEAEWRPEAAPSTVNALLHQVPQDPEARFERLLHASLWGNRIDLSYNIAGHLGSTGSKQDESENLLVDDTRLVWDYLQRLRPARIAVLCDNAGTELLSDLALVDAMLRDGLAAEVTLHVKGQPYFVSDTMPVDVEHGLQAAERRGDLVGRLAARVRRHLQKGRLRLTTHWFNTTSLFYYQLPDDLWHELSACDLVIVKGDANYRRLHGDAHWPYTTPFARAVSYFPAPLAALRTLKGEHVVGLAPGLPEKLQAEDPDWLVNGRRGVIQSHLPV